MIKIYITETDIQEKILVPTSPTKVLKNYVIGLPVCA